MIEKERLKELIEQGAIIYELFENKNINQIQLENNWTVLNGGLYKDINYIRSFWIGDLFETKEEAEWHKEFGCIERTERLELPTWEELGKKKEHYINFTTKGWTKCWLEIYMPYKNDFGKILITYADTDNKYYIVYDKRLTKENYTLACRKCKELFLGEKK
jgi:hypothetical protein